MSAPVLKIRTPEGILFSQLLAGPIIRMLAWSIDLGCILVLVSVATQVAALLGLFSPNIAGALMTLGYFAVGIGYAIAWEWAWRGQTPGKRVLRLRVVDAEGLKLQFNQVVTRNLLRAVDSLPGLYFVGGIACLLSPRCQRLGDLAANTVVIRMPKVTEPDLDQLLPGKYNSLRQHPALVARLRQRVVPAEAALAVQALLRRDQLEPAARIELFAGLAAHFRGKVELAAEAIEGIADEQQVRNIVDVLYR